MANCNCKSTKKMEELEPKNYEGSKLKFNFLPKKKETPIVEEDNRTVHQLFQELLDGIPKGTLKFKWYWMLPIIGYYFIPKLAKWVNDASSYKQKSRRLWFIAVGWCLYQTTTYTLFLLLIH